MPRGVPRSKSEQTKANVQKVNTANVAQSLLDLLNDVVKNLEGDLLGQIRTHPVSDLEDIQRDYRACLKITDMLRSKITDGIIAKKKLNEEV